MIPIIDKENCRGCGDCVKVCPPRAILIVNENAVISGQLCEECGECVRWCLEKVITIPKK